MAENLQPSLFLHLIFLLIVFSSIPQSLSQFDSPQNVETFFPFPLQPLIPPSNLSNQPVFPPPTPRDAFLPTPTLPGAFLQTPPGESSSTKKAVGTAIGVTAASTLLISGLVFFLLQRHSRKRKKDGVVPQGGNNNIVLPPGEFVRFNGNFKGMIVDENGLDVLYWKKLEGQEGKDGFKKQVVKYVKNGEKEEEKRVISRTDGGRKSTRSIQEVPLLKGGSSTSQSPVRTQAEDATPARDELKAVGKQASKAPTLSQTPPPPKGKSPAPPPPPPPPVPPTTTPAPPPPPPIAPVRGPAPSPPPRKTGDLASLKPSTAAKGIQSNASGASDGLVKLKPLHWDKVNANVDHSMVWNKIEGGSFRVNDDLMEALFGYVATNKKSPGKDSNFSIPKGNKYSPPSQIFILDTRKSQNIAIVLRSLAISRREIIDALTDGHGLETDTLEKLNRIAPTKEEESQILAFDGDLMRLADAESFLFHILKAVPSACTRFNAMLFKSNYGSEISPFKESLKTLESACKELRARGVFMKLLEAVLKAGNRMNAGTSRGNAQAFNLTALRKLSDLKSIDGKTTLLHFVVEEVVRAEGKRCVLNRNRSLSRSSSDSSNNGSQTQTPENSISKDQREKEYMTFGLPVVGGLSAEFSNVKKSSTIDYDNFTKTCSSLTTRAAEIRKLVARCGNDGGKFAREMKSFLDTVEEEIKVMSEEQTRVMELVKKTKEYYQTETAKDRDSHPLQLFVIVNDFLRMVDQTCVDITRNLQKRKPATAGTGSSNRRAVKFPVLPPNFMSDRNNSGDPDDAY